MLFSNRVATLVFFLVVALLLLLRPSRLSSVPPIEYLKASSRTASPDILNGTLGFQKVLVINLPERSDRRDAMTIATAVSGIDVEWIDGVAGKDVPDRVLPADSLDKSISKGNKGSWRAHMDALQFVVRNNLTSALIMEDDADWDVRIKSQLQVFAQASRAFTQPTGSKPPTTLAETYGSRGDGRSPPDVAVDQLPSAKGSGPKITPYGDDWDVLWLGHCGTELPKGPAAADGVDDGQARHAADQSFRPPLLRVIIANDPTVPGPEHMKAHPFALKDAAADQYPAHTRIVHASSATTCTQAYAVSQQGARKLLWQFGLQTLTSGWDFMLRDWCDGVYADGLANHSDGRDADMRLAKGPVCVTVQPPLFSHHFGKGGASDIAAPGGGFISKDKEMSPYIRLSVRLNLGRLVRGVGMSGLVDQWSDAV